MEKGKGRRREGMKMRKEKEDGVGGWERRKRKMRGEKGDGGGLEGRWQMKEWRRM